MDHVTREVRYSRLKMYVRRGRGSVTTLRTPFGHGQVGRGTGSVRLQGIGGPPESALRISESSVGAFR